MADDISMSLDVRQLRQGARMFREQIPKEVDKQLKQKIRGLARDIASDAVASARVSIPKSVLSVAVTTRGAYPTAAIRVQKNEPKPHRGKAAAFENAGDSGSFRHPVFGHRGTWVEQEARPFLTPMADELFPWAVERIGGFVDDAMRQAGFH